MALKKRFPKIQSPRNDDICYATTNRQDAVKKIAPLCDVIFVIGSSNSSNSNRLVEVAKQYGCKNASLISSVDDINWDDVRDIKTLGLSAGASAPEVLMNEIISSAREHFAVTVREIVSATEDVHFKLPRELN